MSIKVTITDDHPLVVSGLVIILEQVPHIKVVATCHSGTDLLNGLGTWQPDVILTDLQMPGKLKGLELINSLKKYYPDIPVLVLSGQEALFNVQDMMVGGCAGYLLKNNTDRDMLVDAIERVHKGELYLEPSLRNDLMRSVLKTKKEIGSVAATISRREKEVLQLIRKGYSSQQIADELCLSVRTIDSHRLSLLQKFQVKNAVALITKAGEMGIE